MDQENQNSSDNEKSVTYAIDQVVPDFNLQNSLWSDSMLSSSALNSTGVGNQAEELLESTRPDPIMGGQSQCNESRSRLQFEEPELNASFNSYINPNASTRTPSSFPASMAQNSNFSLMNVAASSTNGNQSSCNETTFSSLDATYNFNPEFSHDMSTLPILIPPPPSFRLNVESDCNCTNFCYHLPDQNGKRPVTSGINDTMPLPGATPTFYPGFYNAMSMLPPSIARDLNFHLNIDSSSSGNQNNCNAPIATGNNNTIPLLDATNSIFLPRFFHAMSWLPATIEQGPTLLTNMASSSFSENQSTCNDNGTTFGFHQPDLVEQRHIIPTGINNTMLSMSLDAYANDIAEPTSSPSLQNKRKKTTSSTGGCTCNCKQSKCLKQYCKCFAAQVYCGKDCGCQECFNKPESSIKILEARQVIKSRNPKAFEDKIIKFETNLEGSIASTSSSCYRFGCNCKKSLCSNKYCECFQLKVGCSDNCRCKGCNNVHGCKMRPEERGNQVCEERLGNTTQVNLETGVANQNSLASMSNDLGATSIQRRDINEASEGRLDSASHDNQETEIPDQHLIAPMIYEPSTSGFQSFGK